MHSHPTHPTWLCLDLEYASSQESACFSDRHHPANLRNTACPYHSLPHQERAENTSVFIVCVRVVCLQVYLWSECVCLVPEEVRRGTRFPGIGSDKCLRVGCGWVLGLKPRSSARAARAFNCSAISPASQPASHLSFRRAARLKKKILKKGLWGVHSRGRIQSLLWQLQPSEGPSPSHFCDSHASCGSRLKHHL